MLEEGVSVKQARKVRRDKGLRLMTARDRWVLRWIGEQGCIRFDQLQELLGREPLHRNQTKAPGPGGLSASAVCQVLNRWMEEPAYITYERVYVDQPGWIRLTTHAERALDILSRSYERTATQCYYVNLVRLNCEQRYPGGRWIARSQPDGEFWIAEQPIAVKVVPSLKRPGQQEEIRAELTELLSNYKTVWCFGAQQALQEMTQAVQRTLSLQDQARVRIIALEDRPGVPVLRS